MVSESSGSEKDKKFVVWLSDASQELLFTME
jgi:hypothetical protein